MVSYLTTNSSIEIWLINSGCTNHITYDQEFFRVLDKIIIYKVRIGNEAYIAIKDKGAMTIEFHTS